MISMETDQVSDLSKEEGVSRKIWFKYFPYWPLFLILLLLSLLGAWVYMRITPPTFESSATILIKDSKRGSEDARLINELNQLSAPTSVENEIEVLKSGTLMDDVVNNLGLYAPIYEDDNLVKRSAYTLSPIEVEVQNPSLITESKKVYFTYNQSKNQLLINLQPYPLGTWVNTPYGILRFKVKRVSRTTTLPLFFLLVDPKVVVSDLSGRLAVSSNKPSSIVRLTITDESQGRSVDILHELISVYNQASLNSRNFIAASTSSFIDGRLNNIAKDLDSMERQLQQYKSRKGVIDIGIQGKLFLENVSVNDQKLSEVNMKASILSQIERNISNNDNTNGYVPSIVGVDDPLLSNLLSKLYELELQYEKLKRTTGENNPQLFSLSDQIKKIKPSIVENIRSQQQSLETSKRTLYSTNNNYNSLLKALPQQDRDLVQINRKQSVESSLYNYLLQKREETAFSNSVSQDSRIIDQPRSSLKPLSPKIVPVYLFSICFAFALAIVIISVRQLLNQTILFRHEIEDRSNFPILGEIALNKGSSPLVIENSKPPFIAEQFRRLRTSLSYVGIGSTKKRILITSTVSGEGKSFLTANLGLSLAMTGKKVVIVEFDLSKPSIVLIVNSTGQKGITDYLKANAKPEELIGKTEVNGNLFLIPAGELPENPSDLISSHLVEELFTYLESKFDYILVDTAPVGLLTDAYVLSKYCDATLYVVRHKYTPKIMLEQLDENNKINELKNLALVFNGVTSRGFGKSYGYSYGYGYYNK